MLLRALHEVRELVGIEGLDDVVIGAALEGLDRRLHGRVGRHDDDGDIGRALREAGLQLEPEGGALR